MYPLITNFDSFNHKENSKILHESMELNINNNTENNNEELTNKIISEFSMIIYKQRQRPKTLRVKSIDGYYNKRDFNNYNLIYKTKLIIELSNYDIIEGKLSMYDNSNENNITIKLNDKKVYSLDNKNFNNEKLVNKLISKYKNHIEKNYKIK